MQEVLLYKFLQLNLLSKYFGKNLVHRCQFILEFQAPLIIFNVVQDESFQVASLEFVCQVVVHHVQGQLQDVPEPVEGVGPPKLILVVKLNLIILLCINLQSQEEREVWHL